MAQNYESFYYYYVRDHKNIPIITVCLFINRINGIRARGVAFCCPKDVFCKKVGRKIAYERAKHAIVTKKSGCETVKRANFKHSLFYKYKASYNPELNERERKILFSQKGGKK